MKPKIIIFAAVILAIAGGLLYFSRHAVKENPPLNNTVTKPIAAEATNISNSAPSTNRPSQKIKAHFSELSEAEKSEFAVNFERRYKPALQKWCNAFNGHVPFSPDKVTPQELVDRIGRNDLYHEYVFVVDGITLGIEDKSGSARVDYLNDPHQTKKLAAQPAGTEAPIANTPVTRDELIKMLAAEGGTQFPANQIRMIPSGFSGSLNGGVMVHVGGDSENAATWDYDMVFGPDGKLAYYLKGR